MTKLAPTDRDEIRERACHSPKYNSDIYSKDICALLDHCTALEEELKQSKAWQMDVEEREAAICPEDVGFDEYIRHLQAELKAAQERIRVQSILLHDAHERARSTFEAGK